MLQFLHSRRSSVRRLHSICCQLKCISFAFDVAFNTVNAFNAFTAQTDRGIQTENGSHLQSLAFSPLASVVRLRNTRLSASSSASLIVSSNHCIRCSTARLFTIECIWGLRLLIVLIWQSITGLTKMSDPFKRFLVSINLINCKTLCD